MKAVYDVCAPAKLNLFLHITGRRADGYHTLQSAFMLIDWCDTLHFERRDDGQISREDIADTVTHGPNASPTTDPSTLLLQHLPADDLCVRAARALRTAAGPGADRLGVHIGLVKRIPSQAGMGGGSSDAASTLLVLNRLWQLNWPLDKLLPIGLALGADVPFFLGGQNAWVEGIGEKMTPIALPLGRFFVVKPPQGLETARIFSHPQLPRNTATAIILGFAANPFQFGRNDLQSVAQTLCPGVGQGLEWLAQLGLQGRMTGSGSAVFAHLAPGFEVGGVHETVAAKPEGFVARLCSNLPSHPLAGWASH
jgi:4-diphosphocytidyl-2-C-methyl-D-erythritol kinase